MIKFAILIALVAAAVAEPIHRFNPLSPTSRIVGGRDTSIDQVPYHVALDVFGTHICSGIIIAEFWILTAAQCMLYFPSWYHVRSGTNRRSGGGVSTPLAFALIHDDYRTNGLGIPVNDIAILRLRSPLVFSSTQFPIRMFASRQEAVVGSSALISGWGSLAEDGNAATILQSVTVPIISKAACNAAYSAFGGLPQGQICALVPGGGRGNCHGDIGGPVAIGGFLAGIISWSNGCGRPGYPGVYSEIAAYRDWIRMMSGV